MNARPSAVETLESLTSEQGAYVWKAITFQVVMHAHGYLLRSLEGHLDDLDFKQRTLPALEIILAVMRELKAEMSALTAARTAE